MQLTNSVGTLHYSKLSAKVDQLKEEVDTLKTAANVNVKGCIISVVNGIRGLCFRLSPKSY